jgi:unsaturated rhamnogalacturonyl hydrolase
MKRLASIAAVLFTISLPACGDTNPPAGNEETGAIESQEAALVTQTVAVKFADNIIARWPDPRKISNVTDTNWGYGIGIVMRGMMEVYGKTNDARYLAYVKKYVDYYVDASGNLWFDSAHTKLVKNQEHNLDLIQPAILLTFLRDKYPSETKYQTAATTVRNMFPNFPKNPDGGFWHKQKYPNEMWVDGLYMSGPFLAKYGLQNTSCGSACFDIPAAQINLATSHVTLPSGLVLHGWDYDNNAAWCIGSCLTTGLSPEVWSRGTGWYAMVLVDLLELMPTTHSQYPVLLAKFQNLAAGIAATQDPTTKLWCQVVGKCSQSGNWKESSGSAMFVYALKKGTKLGYINSSYATVAQDAWNGLKTYMVGSDSSGPTIKDSANGMSVQKDFAAYVAITKMTNFHHGYFAIMVASSLMEY